MKYTCIACERAELSVAQVCELLKVSVSGYYAWHKRQRQPVASTANAEGDLVEQIGQIFVDSRATYGSPVSTPLCASRDCTAHASGSRA